MFCVDKVAFGKFVAALRKEKGFTQKELAERLFISDKAVSKWETAMSVPGIDLLIPLADLLGVTVTELLMCQRMEQGEVLSTEQVEQVVTAAISCSEEEQLRPGRRKWRSVCLSALLIACMEMVFAYRQGCITTGLVVSVSLGAVAAVYFCFFAKEKLPVYYDENRVCVYTDGLFEISLPGLSLNNSNWGKILKVGRIWAMALMLTYPLISYLETLFFTGMVRMAADLFLVLLLGLGGLFIPMYIVGKNNC